jgi:3',5'-cyclic AMP phosphodiesterase CpdA
VRTLAHISDLHFGRLDPPVAEGLVRDLADRHPSLLVASGDFTQRAREGQYRQAAEFLKRLPLPQLVVPGNHDVPMYDFLRRFFDPLGRYRRHISSDLAPIYRDDEMLVLGVSTARSFTHKSGWLTKGQLDAIQRQTCAAPSGLMKVLVTHHPFIPSPRDLNGDIVVGAADALDRLEECGMDLLLAGHLHLAYHDDIRSHHKSLKRSVLSVQAGTATSTRRRHEPNAYNWITLSPDLVAVEVRIWNGQAFEQSLVTRYERINHVWTRQLQIPLDQPAAAALHAPAGVVERAVERPQEEKTDPPGPSAG